MSQVKYCLIVWMFYGRGCLHERPLRMIYDESVSSMSLLVRDNSFSVHDCDIQQLAMELHKVFHGLASKATSVLFLRKNDMQSQLQSELLVPQIKTVYFAQKF